MHTVARSEYGSLATSEIDIYLESPPPKGFVKVDALWVRRSRIAAGWILDATSGNLPAVVDIGCGQMSISAFLPAHTLYIGCDHVARDLDTIVIDLNEASLPLFDVADAVMLGVLEYIDDVPALLAQLQQFERITLSYCTHAFWRSGTKRTRYWRNAYSARQFKALLRAAGFEIVRQRYLRVGEMLFQIKRAA